MSEGRHSYNMAKEWSKVEEDDRRRTVRIRPARGKGIGGSEIRGGRLGSGSMIHETARPTRTVYPRGIGSDISPGFHTDGPSSRIRIGFLLEDLSVNHGEVAPGLPGLACTFRGCRIGSGALDRKTRLRLLQP